MGDETEPLPPPRYQWPRIVLVFILAGVALAILWITLEVRRLRRYREPDSRYAPSGQQAPPSQSPAPGPATGTNPVHSSRP